MRTTSYNRREFLGRAIASGAGGMLATTCASWGAVPAKRKRIKLSTPNAEKMGWRLCSSVYTFRDRSFYETLQVVAGMGVCRVEPAFFLPLDKAQPGLKTGESLPPDKRREMKQRMEDQGISMPDYYAPIDKDSAAWRKIFDFAKEMGVQTLVAEPPPEVLPQLDPLCQEFKINLAVHNHFKGTKSPYWDPDVFVKASQGLSSRIGACPDTGHWVRSGLDTLECLRKYGKRIIAIHLKDAAESGNRDSRDVPLGTGKGNYAGLLQQLHDWKWRGVMTVEYEHQSPQLVQEVTECFQFVEDFAKNAKK